MRTPYGVYQVVITDLFSELSCSNTFFGTTREFNEDHAASFHRPNDYIWSLAGCTNVWRKDYLFVVKVDEQLPIICAGKKSLFWLGLALGGLLAFPNKTAMKIFAGCFGTWYGCSLLASEMNFVKFGSIFARTESCLQVYRPWSRAYLQLTKMWWSVHFLCPQRGHSADEL